MASSIDDEVRKRTMNMDCACEHISHFEKLKHTPNGNPAHDYGMGFSPLFMTTVKTLYGTFRVCKDCAEDCLSEHCVSAASSSIG